jgi:5,10-methylenetetrahydrofolate reductase
MNKNRGRYTIKSFLQQYGGYSDSPDWLRNSIEREEKETNEKKKKCYFDLSKCDRIIFFHFFILNISAVSN